MQGPDTAQAGQSLGLLPGTAEQISVGQSPGLSETKQKTSLKIAELKEAVVNLPTHVGTPFKTALRVKESLSTSACTPPAH